MPSDSVYLSHQPAKMTIFPSDDISEAEAAMVLGGHGRYLSPRLLDELRRELVEFARNHGQSSEDAVAAMRHLHNKDKVCDLGSGEWNELLVELEARKP